MGTRFGTYILVVSSANFAVPIISGGVWNWSVVSRQADASKIIPFPCNILVDTMLVFWYGNVKWSGDFPGCEISMKSHTGVRVELYVSVIFSFAIGYD
jgi:hypothetical protein